MGNCSKAPKIKKKVSELTEENLTALEASSNLDRSTILEWNRNFLVVFFKIIYY